jgi:ABC-2 type transport system ATP-binding protein
MREPAIVIRGLRKSYGELEAVAGVDLTVREGEVFALLGPNGAGKTTTVEILEGYRSRDGGEVSVLGYDPAHGERAMKERIGIVLQSTGVEPYLTAAEVIDMCRGYYPHPRPLDELLGLVDLTEQARVRVGKLSGGQRRRLDLAVGLAGDPDLLFLDEPTTGFDPGARRQAWEVVRNLIGLGKTVLLTTHFMDEAQYLADRLAVMVAGRIVAEGTPAEVVARRSTTTIVRIRLPQGAPVLPPELRALAAGAAQDGGETSGGLIDLRTDEPTPFLNRLTGWAVASGFAFDELTVARPSLEDTYLALTGEADSSGEPAS